MGLPAMVEKGRTLPVSGAPFHWWGAGWSNHETRSLTSLAHCGMIEPRIAALLTLLIEAGVSVTVTSLHRGTGKSTLLAALSGAIDPTRSTFFVRGQYEPFDFLSSAVFHRPVLLANEISPHLPVYAWGNALHGTLQLAASGWQLLATMHGDAPEEIISQLTGSPLRVPVWELPGMGVLVTMRKQESAVPGAVASVTALVSGQHRQGIVPITLDDLVQEGPVLLTDPQLRMFLSGLLTSGENLAERIAARADEITGGATRWNDEPHLFRRSAAQSDGE